MEKQLGIYLEDVSRRYPFLKMIKLLTGKYYLNFIKILTKVTKKADYLNEVINTLDRKSLPLSDPHSLLWSCELEGQLEWACKYFGVTREDIIKYRYGVIKSYQDRSLFDIITISTLLSSVAKTQMNWSKIAEGHKKIIYYPLASKGQIDNSLLIPWSDKLKEPKRVLRDVARGLDIPETIINKPKMGFSASYESWSRENSPLDPLIHLAAKEFDINEMKSMQTGDHRQAKTLWNMINYGLWKRICINNEPIDQIKSELKKIKETISNSGNKVKV